MKLESAWGMEYKNYPGEHGDGLLLLCMARKKDEWEAGRAHT